MLFPVPSVKRTVCTEYSASDSVLDKNCCEILEKGVAIVGVWLRRRLSLKGKDKF